MTTGAVSESRADVAVRSSQAHSHKCPLPSLPSRYRDFRSNNSFAKWLQSTVSSINQPLINPPVNHLFAPLSSIGNNHKEQMLCKRRLKRLKSQRISYFHSLTIQSLRSAFTGRCVTRSDADLRSCPPFILSPLVWVLRLVVLGPDSRGSSCFAPLVTSSSPGAMALFFDAKVIQHTASNEGRESLTGFRHWLVLHFRGILFQLKAPTLIEMEREKIDEVNY